MKKILIIEDDEISRTFMLEAIALLQAECTACGSFAQARQIFLENIFDLIISDINTEDGSLFDNAGNFPAFSKKLAVSADLAPAATAQLLKLGMHEVLAKPMSILSLHQALSRLIGVDRRTPLPLWDEQKSLLAVGQNGNILSTLKAMFRAELPLMTAQIQQAFDCQRHAEIHDVLHKLKASCGFLGASRLLQECSRLDDEISAPHLRQFMDTAKHTLELI